MVRKSRHAIALEQALRKIVGSEYAGRIHSIYLFGSCARLQQKYSSDVDLFVCVNDMDGRSQRRLRTLVEPDDIGLPEVELKFGSITDLETSDDIFYRNIRRDGKLLWERKE